jgi:hypothetical protein
MRAGIRAGVKLRAMAVRGIENLSDLAHEVRAELGPDVPSLVPQDSAPHQGNGVGDLATTRS